MCKVCGVGIDLCEISRMNDQLGKPSFMARVFTEAEIAYIMGRGLMASASMAGIWAAKEAALKALGTGLTLPMRDIEVTHDDLGRPLYCLHGKALEASEGGGMQLSITHEGGMAAAVCVWSK